MTEAPAAPGFRLAAGPAGPVEHAVTGSGDPVTLFVHGLTGSVAQTRPFGSGVPGSKVFVHLRGHGGTPVPDDGPGTVADLAAEVDAVRRETGATRAFGVSLGAAALLRLLADAARDGAPSPFERVVLALPAALDEPDTAPAGPLLALAAALDARDPGTAAGLLRDLQPAAVRRLPAVGLWARRRAAELVHAPGSPGLAAVLRAFSRSAPLALGERSLLARVDVPVLVVGQEEDDAHPLGVARDLAAALPVAELVVVPPGGVLWSGRDRLRAALTSFFDASE